jgi:hypothetical protein
MPASAHDMLDKTSNKYCRTSGRIRFGYFFFSIIPHKFRMMVGTNLNGNDDSEVH